MAEDFDLSCTNKFEVELGSSLRHCCNTSRKLKQLALNAAELKINNQINLSCKENDIGLSVKNILDEVQNLRSKLSTIETTFDCSDKIVLNLGETVQELESVVNIVSKNKNTIFTHLPSSITFIMSFKRVCDGSGSDLLKSLESQRIRELLGIQIPDGEAKLLSNGKLTCMICIQRPIFDTINVLSIHRKGKKHLNELSKYLERKEELELIKIKQQQKNCVQSFGASKLYTNSTERKTKLELPEDDSVNSKESSIVSRYVSSMKKKPSLQDVINRARKHPYQQQVSNSHTSVSKNTSDITQSTHTSSNKEIEIGWIINSDGSWSKDPQAEFDSDDDW